MIGYGKSDREIATCVWYAWSKLDIDPNKTSAEVLAAVAQTDPTASDYCRMKQAMRLLGWV